MHIVPAAIARCCIITTLAVGMPLMVRAQANPPPSHQDPAAMGAMDSTDRPSAMAAHDAMSGPLGADPYMVLTPPRPASQADSARAAALVRTERVLASVMEAVIGACYLAYGFERTAAAVVEAFESELGVRCGETTEDGAITLRAVECLGGCGWPTIVAVDDYHRRDVQAADVSAILGELRGG